MVRKVLFCVYIHNQIRLYYLTKLVYIDCLSMPILLVTCQQIGSYTINNNNNENMYRLDGRHHIWFSLQLQDCVHPMDLLTLAFVRFTSNAYRLSMRLSYSPSLMFVWMPLSHCSAFSMCSVYTICWPSYLDFWLCTLQCLSLMALHAPHVCQD